MWKPIPGYEGLYEVSSEGAVRRVGGKVLAACAHPRGYLSASLWKGNKGTMHLVHRLVAAAFIGPVDGREVNHLNGEKTDNRAENLELVSRQGNIDHAVITGLIRNKGERNAQAKLTVEQVREIRARYVPGRVGYKRLSSEYGVNPSHIRDIVKGKRWEHEQDA